MATQSKRLIWVTLLCLIAVLTVGAAFAEGEVLTLPADTVSIGARAFYGSGAAEVVLPSGCKTIGAAAFGNMTSLARVTVPASVDSIAEDAFDGSDDVCLVVKDGSYAHQFAKDNGINYVFDPVYRAFLVGQSYKGTENALYGTVHDRDTIGSMLETMTATPYSVTKAEDLTGSGIISGIQTAFADATDGDVSLFYYSGHGSMLNGEGGYLIGTNVDMYSMNDGWVSPTRLRNALDTIPGKKIILVDACNSGGLVGQYAAQSGLNAQTAQQQSDAFVESFIAAFSTKERSNLAASDYYVLVAATGSQTSAELGVPSRGFFTWVMTEGCGWDEIFDTRIDTLKADTNGDGLLTLAEIYTWTKTEVDERTIEMNENIYSEEYKINQTTTCYPSNSNQVLFGRGVSSSEE